LAPFLTLLAVALMAALTWRNGAVEHVDNVNDTAAFLDGVWRIHLGQRPHQDFHSIVGALPFALGAAAMRLTGPRAAALACELALLQLMVAGVAYWAARPRLGALAAGLMAVGLALLVGAPHVLGTPYGRLTFGNFYNRLGWSVALAAWLCALMPRRDAAWPRSETMAVGVMTGALLFIKANYFAVTVAVVALGWSRRRGRWTAAAEFMGTVLATAALITAATGSSFPGYLNDLATSGRSQEWWKLGSYVARAWASNWAAIAAVLLLIALDLRISLRNWWGAWRSLAAVAAGMIVMQANSHGGVAPAIPLAGLLLAEGVRRTGARPLVVGLNGAAALGLAATILVPDAIAVSRAAWKHRPSAHPDGGAVFLPGVLGDLPLPLRPGESADPAAIRRSLLARGADSFGMSPAQWWVSCNDALMLVRQRAGPQARLLTMDLFNPWSLMLEDNPPRGDWIAWDPGRNFTGTSHPAFAELAGEATHVLVPRVAYYPPSARLKLEVYGADLRRQFRICAESDLWTLWERRPTAAPGPRTD